MTAAWSLADITMGGMTLINLPACVALSGVVIKAYKDYEKQKRRALIRSLKRNPSGWTPKNLISGNNFIEKGVTHYGS